MTTLQTVQAQLESKFIEPLEYNSFYLSIGDILSNHWDPLDIFDSIGHMINMKDLFYHL